MVCYRGVRERIEYRVYCFLLLFLELVDGSWTQWGLKCDGPEAFRDMDVCVCCTVVAVQIWDKYGNVFADYRGDFLVDLGIGAEQVCYASRALFCFRGIALFGDMVGVWMEEDVFCVYQLAEFERKNVEEEVRFSRRWI